MPRLNRGPAINCAAVFGTWSITARCQAERERRMALEALVGGKCF
jgi:hypothetical protein